MSIQVKLDNVESKEYIEIAKLPNICPICNAYMSPNLLYSCIQTNNDVTYTLFHVFYGCQKCSQIFCVTYKLYDKQKGRDFVLYKINPISTLPPVQTKTTIDDRINQISQRAVELFHQAENAENEGLSELAGMGFRKALECVVKDSLVQLGMQTNDQVAKLDLRDAIGLFKENPRLVKDASQARVIGNDYAHYEARYENYDITSLKNLLSRVFRWLSDVFDSDELEELQKKNQPST